MCSLYMNSSIMCFFDIVTSISLLSEVLVVRTELRTCVEICGFLDCPYIVQSFLILSVSNMLC